jgi:hypothetical protein
MELVGEEKRIQALFSELRFADEQARPEFAAVWNRAQATMVRPARAFNLSFVAATALLMVALVSLAWWSRHSQENLQQRAVVEMATTTPAAGPVQAIKEASVNPIVAGENRDRPSSTSRARRLAAQRRALMLAVNRKAARDAKEISSWASPTSALLKSQNDELLKSLPQLSESVDELKSFLPNTPN